MKTKNLQCIIVIILALLSLAMVHAGTVNELLITNLNDDPGRITIFGYNAATENYDSLWATDTTDVSLTSGGGVIGDITHDGNNDFVLARYDGKWGLDVWTYNPAGENWHRVWDGDFGGRKSSQTIYIAAIGDFDNDGYTEMFIHNRATEAFEVWGNDVANAASFSLQVTVRSGCGATYRPGAGDLNGDVVPELFLQCSPLAGPLEVYGWNGTGYSLLQSISKSTWVSTNTVDDMDCSNDVNRDGKADCVFCGNGGRSHILSYVGSSYQVVYNSANGAAPSSYTQSCNSYDVTNDGYADFFDESASGLRIFSYDGSNFYSLWNSTTYWTSNPGIAAGGAGDSDNDGKGEFLVANGSGSGYDTVFLWESDSTPATSFTNTFTWTPADTGSSNAPNVIIGNLNPYNDNSGGNNSYNCLDTDIDSYFTYDSVACPTGNDCNDNNAAINPGATDVCGDNFDNNCNGQVDEGCASAHFCGDGVCDGSAYSENCNTCSADCWAGSRGACCGDGKCDTNNGVSAAICPVDC